MEDWLESLMLRGTSSRYHSLHRSTLSVFPLLGTNPFCAVLVSFKVAIAKCVADALPPLTVQVEQVYMGVDYGKKGVDFTIALPCFRLPGKVDVLAKTVIDQVCTKHVAPGDLAYDKPF
jgi:hypothetical protein